MEHFFPEYTQCLTHQLPEDQSSPAGLVCPLCKQRLYLSPPQGRSYSCWESQPEAYSLHGEPCFVYTIIWEDFRIRSLHPAGVLIDSRSVNHAAILSDSDLENILEFNDSESPPFNSRGEAAEEGFSPPEEFTPSEEEDFTPPDDDEFGLWRPDEETEEEE